LGVSITDKLGIPLNALDFNRVSKLFMDKRIAEIKVNSIGFG
jgi:hypothetical protein